MTTTTKVEVFLGDDFAHDSERAFLTRLRADLTRRGCGAHVFANFFTRNGQRQIDFLIATAHRVVHAELKTVDPELPLIGGINGPWAQQMSAGPVRPLDRNYFAQANTATFSISDDMHALAQNGAVPHLREKFYTRFQTVICLNPGIPVASRLDTHRHVEVVGYLQLLELLTTDGPRPDWADEHWLAFARYLQLVRDQPDPPGSAAQRALVVEVDDYRRRFTATHGRDAHEYIPVSAAGPREMVQDPAAILAEAMMQGRVVAFTGESGAGKSHAARHAALRVAADGGVPIWVRCNEYQRGRFSHALARSVAPFTEQSGLQLLRYASDTGSPAAVILDGLNECSPADRAELLEQLDALRLRMPVAAIVTSTTPVGISADLTLNAMTPDEETRALLLASYGHAEGLAGVEAFRTPMELALAAECGAHLPPDAAVAEVFDAYISHHCPAETTRAGLRWIAVEMDRQLRGSLRISEIRALLHRAIDGAAPDAAIDLVLDTPLMARTQGRAAFRHELFGRFLTAEHIVLQSHTIPELAEQLQLPVHADLVPYAIALQHDPNRRHDLLLTLTDPAQLDIALRGEYGSETAQAIHDDIEAALVQATIDTGTARIVRQDGGPNDMSEVRWTVSAPRNAQQQALLHVAGSHLAEGRFLEPTTRLLDATDRRCGQQMRQLQDEGHRAAISAVVRALHSGFYYADERELCRLPASVVIAACENSRTTRRGRALTSSPARALWENPAFVRPLWARLTVILRLIDRDDPDAQTLLPDVFTAASAAGGYHLRLAALDVALCNAATVDSTTRDRMRTALDECDTDHIFLNGTLFEALAAYGGLEPLNTEDGIRTQIEAILAEPENPDAWGFARGVVGMIFEDQNLHGPYDQVLDGLEPRDCLRLHVMAARAEGIPMHRDWIMRVIVDNIDHADVVTQSVLRRAATSIDRDDPFPQEAIGTHLTALRGWAELSEVLPVADDVGDALELRAWRIVDELLFAAIRGGDPMSGELLALWTELLGSCAPAAADVVTHVKAARMFEFTRDRPAMYERLLTLWPHQMRQLIEWAIRNTDLLVGTLRHPAHDCPAQLIEDLGIIGTTETATLLKHYIGDPKIGTTAVAVIRAIEQRMNSILNGDA
ncbi:hypothetical protein [Nocardia sp. NPDC055049]